MQVAVTTDGSALGKSAIRRAHSCVLQQYQGTVAAQLVLCVSVPTCAMRCKRIRDISFQNNICLASKQICVPQSQFGVALWR